MVEIHQTIGPKVVGLISLVKVYGNGDIKVFLKARTRDKLVS